VDARQCRAICWQHFLLQIAQHKELRFVVNILRVDDPADFELLAGGEV
jgi:hypothetical protein